MSTKNNKPTAEDYIAELMYPGHKDFQQYQQDVKLKAFNYLNDITKIIKYIASGVQLPLAVNVIDIMLIGSRLSGKTKQILCWLIELGYLPGAIIDTVITRWEPKGAIDTYDEVCDSAESSYGIEVTRKNGNTTKKKLSLPSNHIRVKGITSNRKGKIASLGSFRGRSTKQVQINVFEEVTEVDNEKTISKVKQATGGAQLIINVFIANPWVLSMWYVKKVNKFLPFNEKQLREKGQQIKHRYDLKKKKLIIAHITNHRVNTYLWPAQHQELFDIWDIDETLARVADLGMPGVAEGLIYAPVLHNVLNPPKIMPTLGHRAGLDWGTSTGAKGSATALLLGRIGYNYSTVCIDDEYYHSNANQYYKSDVHLVTEIIDKLLAYVKENVESIRKSQEGILTVSWDYGAFTLGALLQRELDDRRESLARFIVFQECHKYRVPVRVDIVKSLMGQGRYKVNKEKCPMHWQELEGAQWDPTRMVDGRPTRLNEEDHTCDAMEYLIGADLMNLADARYLKHNKLLR